MAFTKILSQISPTLVKIDSGSPGTVVPAGATDDLLTHGPSVKFTPRTTFIDIRHHSAAFTRRQGIPADRVWDISCQFYMQGSGALGTSAVNGYAAIDALMRAAVMTRTANAGTSLVYTPAAIGSHEKCVIYNENNGTLHKANDCQGNIVFEGTPTDGMNVTWTGIGTYTDPTIATISGFTGGTDRSEAFLSVAGTITPASGGAAYTPVIQSARFDRGVQLGKVSDANSATGVRENFARDAEPTLSMVLACDSDGSAGVTYAKFYSDYLAKINHTVAYTQGTTTGNKARFNFPQAQIRGLSRQEGDGYILLTVDYRITHTTDNSEFTITIT